MIDLDPQRLQEALETAERMERAAADYEREAAQLRRSATARRARWGLPPAGHEPPEFQIAT